MDGELEVETNARSTADADARIDEPRCAAKLRPRRPNARSGPAEPEDEATTNAARHRNDTCAMARQIATTEMRNLLNRVVGHEAAAANAGAAAASKPAKIWDIAGASARRQRRTVAASPKPLRAGRAGPRVAVRPCPGSGPGGRAVRGADRRPSEDPASGLPAGDDHRRRVRGAEGIGAGGRPGAEFPTGWIVVTEGPGRGACFTLGDGVSQIGRGEDQAIRLDFGDTSISRNNHAAVAFDPETGKFFLGHGGKSNLVRLNNRPVLSTEELASNDRIRIGETVLRFVALCGEEFSWVEEPGRGARRRKRLSFGMTSPRRCRRGKGNTRKTR